GFPWTALPVPFRARSLRQFAQIQRRSLLNIPTQALEAVVMQLPLTDVQASYLNSNGEDSLDRLAACRERRASYESTSERGDPRRGIRGA
ncbi:MAG TPA: hypothetical protein VH601_08035, partial [Bryobacteraceae bacterium]